jgi:hypothetical protein
MLLRGLPSQRRTGPTHLSPCNTVRRGAGRGGTEAQCRPHASEVPAPCPAFRSHNGRRLDEPRRKDATGQVSHALVAKSLGPPILFVRPERPDVPFYESRVPVPRIDD